MDIIASDRIAQLLSAITNNIANGAFNNKSIEILETALVQMETYKSIDQDLVKTLKDELGTESLYNKDSYDNVIKLLKEGSVLIYFEFAQLFKVYKKDDVSNLLSGQLHTVYKYFNTSYEIIPNNSKQKIIILTELSLEQHLSKIKQYIISFIHDHGNVNLNTDDVICFKNMEAETIEIVINNYYVKNSTDRDEIVKALLEYIREKEKNNQITRKMGFQSTSVFKDANMIATPSNKQIIQTNLNHEQTKDLVETNQHMDVNTQHTNNIKKVVDTDENNADNFIKYINEHQPEWYTPNKLVSKALLQTKYEELYGEISQKRFHMLFHNIMFGNNVRNRDGDKKITMVKLRELVALPTLISTQNVQHDNPSDNENMKVLTGLVSYVADCQLFTFHNYTKKYASLPTSNQYVYLLRARENFHLQQNIYKIGMTERPFIDRLKDYRGCEFIQAYKVIDALYVEKKLKQAFNEKFTKIGEFASEYYQGELSEIIELFENITKEYRLK